MLVLKNDPSSLIFCDDDNLNDSECFKEPGIWKEKVGMTILDQLDLSFLMSLLRNYSVNHKLPFKPGDTIALSC